jgi:hypothetical protein
VLSTLPVIGRDPDEMKTASGMLSNSAVLNTLADYKRDSNASPDLLHGRGIGGSEHPRLSMKRERDGAVGVRQRSPGDILPAAVINSVRVHNQSTHPLSDISVNQDVLLSSSSNGFRPLPVGRAVVGNVSSVAISSGSLKREMVIRASFLGDGKNSARSAVEGRIVVDDFFRGATDAILPVSFVQANGLAMTVRAVLNHRHSTVGSKPLDVSSSSSSSQFRKYSAVSLDLFITIIDNKVRKTQ